MQVLQDLSTVLEYIRFIPRLSSDYIRTINTTQGRIQSMLQLAQHFVPIGQSASEPPMDTVAKLNTMWSEVVIDLNSMVIKITSANGPATPSTTTG